MSDHVIDGRSAPRLYEAAYLVNPTVPEEKVAGVILPLKDMLAAKNGNSIAEEAPLFRRLAYPIRAAVAGSMSGVKSKPLGSAFFGWVRFEADAATAAEAKNILTAIPDIIRFLLIHAEAPVPMRSFPGRFARAATAPHSEPASPKALPTVPSENPKGAVSQEELDRKIEELVGA